MTVRNYLDVVLLAILKRKKKRDEEDESLMTKRGNSSEWSREVSPTACRNQAQQNPVVLAPL